MTSDELQQALRDRFDAGEDLTPALREAIAASPEATAYWERLKLLDADLWSLPLEQPSSDLVPRVQRGVARDREARMVRRAAALAVAAALVALAVFTGWRYPQYASPEAWWYTVSEYLPEQQWLENTTPLEAQIFAAWTAIDHAWQDTFAFSWTLLLPTLAGAVLILVLFNATGARALRIAGSAGAHDRSHHP